MIAVVFSFTKAFREGSRLETAWRNQLFKEGYQGAGVLQMQDAPETDHGSQERLLEALRARCPVSQKNVPANLVFVSPGTAALERNRGLGAIQCV